MWSDPNSPSASDLHRTGLQAIASLREERWRLPFWRNERVDLYDAVSRFIQVVYETNIKTFTDEQFALSNDSLTLVINGIESYLARHVDSNDTSQCYFLGYAVQRLKDARYWIAQGYSPDPNTRPSVDERRARAQERASTAFQDLVNEA